MNKNNKTQLSKLEVSSFITSLDNQEKLTAQGGSLQIKIKSWNVACPIIDWTPLEIAIPPTQNTLDWLPDSNGPTACFTGTPSFANSCDCTGQAPPETPVSPGTTHGHDCPACTGDVSGC